MASALPQEPGDGMTLGLRMLVARRVAGFRLIDVEKLTGIPNSALSRYENDQAMPTVKRLEAIARVLGTTPDALLGFGGTRADLNGERLGAAA